MGWFASGHFPENSAHSYFSIFSKLQEEMEGEGCMHFNQTVKKLVVVTIVQIAQHRAAK